MPQPGLEPGLQPICKLYFPQGRVLSIKLKGLIIRIIIVFLKGY